MSGWSWRCRWTSTPRPTSCGGWSPTGNGRATGCSAPGCGSPVATAARPGSRCGAVTGVGGSASSTPSRSSSTARAAVAVRGPPHREGRAGRRRVRGGRARSAALAVHDERAARRCRSAHSAGSAGRWCGRCSGPGSSTRCAGMARQCEAEHRARLTWISVRCGWAGSAPEYVAYHDDEWGRPLHGVQAHVRAAQPGGVPVGAVLAGDPAQAAGVPRRVRRLRPGRRGRVRRRPTCTRLLADAGIVRNRAKIEATVHNAAPGAGARDTRSTSCCGPSRRIRRAGAVRRPSPTCRRPRPSRPRWPASSSGRGLRFVGPTTCYALMQAAGLVDDHVADCWRAAT